MKLKNLILIAAAGLLLASCDNNNDTSTFKETSNDEAKAQINKIKNKYEDDSFSLPNKVTAKTVAKTGMSGVTYNVEGDVVLDTTTGSEYYYVNSSIAGMTAKTYFYHKDGQYVSAVESSLGTKTYQTYNEEEGKEKFDSQVESASSATSKTSFISTLEGLEFIIDGTESDIKYNECKFYVKGDDSIKMEASGTGTNSSGEYTFEQKVTFESYLLTYVYSNSSYVNDGSSEALTIGSVETSVNYTWNVAEHIYPDLTGYTQA